MVTIHHVNLPANDVRVSAKFYTEIIGMSEGTWVFPPAEQVGHISADDHNPSIGGHVALQVTDLDAVVKRLEQAGVPYSLTGTFAIPGMRHLYCYDPSMNLLEINEMIA